MQFAICSVAAAPLRSEPSHRSEMISQLLFGETMVVLEQKEYWYKIKGFYDGYEGWATDHMLSEIAIDTAEHETKFVSTAIISSLTTPDGCLHLPMGASLHGYDPASGHLWDKRYSYKGEFRNVSDPFSTNLLLQLSHNWLNVPYLWGGRTLMGVDCSGFVQVVFKVLGLPLLRDAYLQATQGKEVGNLDEAKEGDLAFFVNEAGRIIHVGIVLSGSRIIHAAGKVRIDPLDPEGIINKDTQKRTHVLQSIRRYF